MALRTEAFTGTVHEFDSGDGWFQTTAPTAFIRRDGSGRGESFGAADAYITDTQNTYNNAQYSKLVIITVTSGAEYAQVITRASITDLDGMAMYTDGASGAGHSGCQRWDNGTATDLGPATVTFATNDVLEGRSNGSSHDFVKNNSVITTFSDATYASGSTGPGAYGGTKIDDWEGGNLAVAGDTILLDLAHRAHWQSLTAQ